MTPGYKVSINFSLPQSLPSGFAVGVEFAPDSQPHERIDSELQMGGMLPAAFRDFNAIVLARYFERVTALVAIELLAPEPQVLAGSLAALYDSNVDRAEGHATISGYQPANPEAMPTSSLFQASEPVGLLIQSRAQQADGIATELATRMQDTKVLSHAVLHQQQQACTVGAQVAASHQVAESLFAQVSSAAQQALLLHAGTAAYWQDGIPLVLTQRSRWQEAGIQRDMGLRTPQAVRNAPGYAIALEFAPEFIAPRDWSELQFPPFLSRIQVADAAYVALVSRHQQAMQPGPAAVKPTFPGGGGTEPEPEPEPGTIYVLRRDVYMVVNEIELTRLEGNVPLHPLAFDATLDANSWTWTWSATLHESMGRHLGLQSDGEKPILEAVINGQRLRLRLESKTLDERFNPTRWQVGGRGHNSVLSDLEAERSFTAETAMSAQQLALNALTMNGVDIGWGLNWRIADWHVPAGVWAHNGTYISAIKDIAEAVGGYVQPDMTSQTLHILPRYPVMPWEWHSHAADYDLPDGLAVVRSTDFVEQPKYNGIWIAGESQGVSGFITRRGTLGGIQKEQVIHPLITAPEAQLARGSAELADTGLQEHVSLRVPVLPETGLILPGKFVRNSFPASANRDVFGIVRKIGISYSSPVLRQTLTLETHPNV